MLANMLKIKFYLVKKKCGELLMKELKVISFKGVYPIFCGRGLLPCIGDLLSDRKIVKPQSNIYIITDRNVEQLYGNVVLDSLKSKNYKTNLLAIPAGELSKDFDMLKFVLSDMVSRNIKRTDTVLALGGGVVGDLAGFAAHIYMRGINFVQVPTSLLAQVDSSVGSKVAVNLPEGKNLIGGFCPPSAVLSDTDTLSTLPKAIFSDGMAEVIKYGAILDSELFKRIEEAGYAGIKEIIDYIVYRCCELKKEVVERDETEKGDRMILNFGHTFGHVIEKVLDFGTYSHGQAVAIGMYRMAVAGENQKWTEPGTARRIGNILDKFELPLKLKLNEEVKVAEMITSTLKVDKKGGTQGMNIVILDEIGKCRLKKISYIGGNRLWEKSLR